MGNKKGKVVLFALIVAAAVAAAAGGGIAWYMHTLQCSSDFLDGTKINGTDVSGQTPAEAAAAVREAFDGGQVVLTEDGKEVFRAGLTALGYSLDAEELEGDLTEMMYKEKTDVGTVVQGLREGNDFSMELPYRVDENTFKEVVRAEALSAPRIKNKNAKILYYEEEKACRIRPEVQGTELEDEALQDWLRTEIGDVIGNAAQAEAGDEKDSSGEKASDDEAGSSGRTDAAAKAAETMESADGFDVCREIPDALYTPPERTADSESLQEKCEILNRYAGESVTYIFGDKTETLGFETIMNWLKIKNGEVSVREDKVAAYVRKLAEKYETRYLERTFTTTWGNVVTFPAGLNEYGYTILEDQEAAQLAQDILSGEPVEREPVYQYLGAWGDPLFLKRSGTDDLAGTYVEVSISAQHMWYYIDGALFIESDVVTGDITLDQGTATGVFPLAFKESPSVLRGGEGKKKYETKVQYWMPFYEGQGLHDAWWKTVFGGTEYIGNGSHGCVNLPSWVAETVYNNIEPGTAIIIYY